MVGLRIIMGRPRGARGNTLQSFVFDRPRWTKRDAQAWLTAQGFDPRDLVAVQGRYRYTVRDRSVFVPRSLRTVSIDRWEHVTMASNPKGKKKRSSKKARKAPRKRRPARRAKSKRASSRAKTTRTTLQSTKVVKVNARKKKKKSKRKAKRAGRRSPPRPARRYTIALSPGAARRFATIARLAPARRREMLGALRRHAGGGVYVALPAWHGSQDQARRLADRVQLVLAYDAGRRRESLAGASVPRVVAVP